MKNLLLIFFLIVSFSPINLASAHQKIDVKDKTSKDKIEIQNPDQAKAIYGELQGDFLQINFKTDENIELYLSILTPDSARKNFSVDVYGPNNQLIGVIDGDGDTWRNYSADFDGNRYFQGPELKQNIAAGAYYLRISNLENEGPFVLLIGNNDGLSLSESYYSAARGTNRTILRFDNYSPWGLLVVLIGLSATAIAIRIYIQKNRK